MTREKNGLDGGAAQEPFIHPIKKIVGSRGHTLAVLKT